MPLSPETPGPQTPALTRLDSRSADQTDQGPDGSLASRHRLRPFPQLPGTDPSVSPSDRSLKYQSTSDVPLIALSSSSELAPKRSGLLSLRLFKCSRPTDKRQTFTPSRPQLLKQAASQRFRPLRRIKPGESALSRDPAATPSPALRPWCSSHLRRLRLLQALTALFHAAGTHGVTYRPDPPSTAPLPGPDSAAQPARLAPSRSPISRRQPAKASSLHAL
jgi:hypothetical protein